MQNESRGRCSVLWCIAAAVMSTSQDEVCSLFKIEHVHPEIYIGIVWVPRSSTWTEILAYWDGKLALIEHSPAVPGGLRRSTYGLHKTVDEAEILERRR
jgi:hypothetical protein